MQQIWVMAIAGGMSLAIPYGVMCPQLMLLNATDYASGYRGDFVNDDAMFTNMRGSIIEGYKASLQPPHWYRISQLKMVCLRLSQSPLNSMCSKIPKLRLLVK